MQNLIIGQNITLDKSIKRFIVESSQQLALVSFSLHGNKLLNSNTITLQELVEQGVTKVEFFAKQSGTIVGYVDYVEFLSVTAEVSSAVALVGRLYLHQGEWRFRALNESFTSLELAASYSQIDALFPVNTVIQERVDQAKEQVQNAVSQVRTALQESGVEQVVRQGADSAIRHTKKLANGLQQTFIQVMGNSDDIARQQAENDFKPMDMVKMQSVQFPPEITNLHLGLGWKSKSGKGLLKGLLTGNKSINVDLDLSVQMLSNIGEVIDTVYFDKVRSDNHSVVHYGDASQGGNGFQDNEVISIALNNLPPKTTFLAVTVTSQKGHQFSGLENGYLRVVNQQGMIPLVQINLDPLETKTGALLGIFVLNSANMWEFVAVSDYCSAKTVQELAPNILHWAKLIGQSRQVVSSNSQLLNHQN